MNIKFKMFLLSLCTLFLIVGCDKDDDNNHNSDRYEPTAAVINAFNGMFPDATRVEWEAKLGYAVAEFRLDGKEKDAWFDAGGQWMLTETKISAAELPEKITNALNTDYSGWRVDDVSYLERPDMASVYVIEVEQGKQELDLYYSVDGVLLKTVTDGGSGHQAVPTPVNEKILKVVAELYPDYKIVEVDVEPNTIEVDIVRSTVYAKMILDKEYNWIQTEWEAEWIRVPQAVKDAFTTDGYTFNSQEDEVDMIIRPSEVILYRIELDREPNDIILYYTDGGIRVEE